MRAFLPGGSLLMKFDDILIPTFSFYVQNNVGYGLNYIFFFVVFTITSLSKCLTICAHISHTCDVGCAHYNSTVHGRDVGRVLCRRDNELESTNQSTRNSSNIL